MNSSPSRSPQRRILTVTEDDADVDLDTLLIDDCLSAPPQYTTIAAPPTPYIAALPPRASIPISAIEEDIDTSISEWVLPSPSRPGEYLSNSVHKVPSKSILKKTSSYGKFDMNMSISSSRRMGRSTDSTYGLDLDSSSQSQFSTACSGGYGRSMSLPSQSPCVLDLSEFDADAAAGTLEISSGSSNKIKRSVSFDAVNVRKYDRTIGDNPSCKSGPPISLDWSYSISSSKSIDEYEVERFPHRVHNHSRLRINKYTRRNILAFQWGHSQEEMKEARAQTKRLQRQRSLTQVFLPVTLCYEAYLGIKKFATRGNKNIGLSRDELDELSLSSSKHVESIGNSIGYGGSVDGGIGDLSRSPNVVNEIKVEDVAVGFSKSLGSKAEAA